MTVHINPRDFPVKDEYKTGCIGVQWIVGLRGSWEGVKTQGKNAVPSLNVSAEVRVFLDTVRQYGSYSGTSHG